ncbi:dipeptidase PepV [Neobacillus sp. PS3-34]|uniref:dipeptidase PepV n=1 Tax=Neobacillus sp. PS3-34 TaxID=3070678 RepID=UPI0027DF76F2|nr:dipeptidase PepV [Neobacillus sp. PS3-34]WML48719.1 dipeptidase PepV [Neobacillus sp. PS3-34]
MINWHEEVLSRKDELLEDLFNLLRIESTKDLDSKTEGRPMGEKIGEALEYILEKAKQNGFRTKNLAGYAGYAEYGSSNAGDPIGILCHVDVVPATGEWTSPPFEPAIRDGKIYARGAIDDKGPSMAAFYAMKIVKESGLALSKNVRIIFGTDEESGMNCMKYYSEVEGMPTSGFAPDANFPIINAEKGQITVKLSLPNTNTDYVEKMELLSFHAGNRVNMVPERATAAIIGFNESLMKDFEEFCSISNVKSDISYKENTAELTLYGISAHAMEPHKGVNAATTLARFLQSYTFQAQASKFICFLADLHKDFEGKSLGISYSDDITGPLTVNPGILYFEGKGEAFLQINARIPVTTDYETTKEKLKVLVDQKGFILSELRESQPHYVDPSTPIIKGLKRAYEEETNQKARLLSTGGATYARFMKQGVAFGACFPGKEMTAHEKDEYIEIEDLLRATAIYARAIYELAK